MARILYALSGQGRGHTSRVMAISSALRARGHEICFIGGGTALDILAEQGEDIIPVPALRQEIKANRLQLWKTFTTNWKNVAFMPRHVARLARRMEAFEPDLLITDFEVYSARAAKVLGLPVLSFDHQHVVTETEYELPPEHRRGAFLTSLVIKAIEPKDPAHTLLTSFYFPPLKRPGKATVIDPIIRPEVQRLSPRKGEYVLGYFNDPNRTEPFLKALSAVDARFILYNVPRPERSGDYPNITFKEPSLDDFLEDLASCRAVVSTAGFMLMSESLYLGKPVLAIPNEGIFEQTLNALFLDREGLGEAVIDRDLTAEDVEGFLGRLSTYEARLQGRISIGNDEAVACIERVLHQTGRLKGVVLPQPAGPRRRPLARVPAAPATAR